MRFDLRLHGRTADGRKCRADISVYASAQSELKKEADAAARSAAWEYVDPPHEALPKDSVITVEGVVPLGDLGKAMRSRGKP